MLWGLHTDFPFRIQATYSSFKTKPSENRTSSPARTTTCLNTVHEAKSINNSSKMEPWRCRTSRLLRTITTVSLNISLQIAGVMRTQFRLR